MIGFDLRAICLSDLDDIIKIHQKEIRGNTGTEQLPENLRPGLTETFGLPLGLAHSENRMIGYSYAFVDEKNEIHISSSFENDSERAKAGEVLLDFSRKVLYSSFGGDYKDPAGEVAKIRNSIRILVDWINRAR